ncbi:Zinc transporter ZIP8 [Sarcoptes scabiei]|uniref:Zinc transporter ZIP8 n=1 Tax=Sarcoptes scabiei TaxID=52283 RepID=A0A834R2E6_SARSC|nr:Zinc transporter ZIP8 [Sarcoptes scabiei]
MMIIGLMQLSSSSSRKISFQIFSIYLISLVSISVSLQSQQLVQKIESKDLDYEEQNVSKDFLPIQPSTPLSSSSLALFTNIINRSLQQDSNVGLVSNMLDIVKLVRFVLLRNHIVLDASHRVLVQNGSRIDRLLDYLHQIQLRKGKHRISPMDDRDLACDEIVDSKMHIKKLCHAATFDCLSASEFIQMLPKPIAFHQAIARICPLLLFRQTRPICLGDVKKLLDDHDRMKKKIQLVEPSIEKVWAFGILFVTISILVSMGGLILLPFVKKSSRMTILTFFEGLAVGGLSGSAILHLFPEAFDIVDEKYRAYFWNTTCIFLGIYSFYCIEIFIKILKTYKGKNKRKRVPSINFRDDDLNNFETIIRQSPLYCNNSIGSYRNDYKNSDVHSLQAISMQELRMINDSPNPNGCGTNSPNKEALINSTREQLAQCLSTVNVLTPSLPVMGQRQNTSPIRRLSKEQMVQNVALRRQDHETSNIIIIDTVAWMIILGDALLNFIDGLSIGAAFDRNILAGMSISVAVMLEEVTHRLGTFAVLIRAGMSMKQSFFYIFLSACHAILA